MNRKPLSLATLEPLCAAVAYVLRKHRLSRHLTLTDMEEKTLLSRQGIAFVETLKHVPTLNTMARICRAHGISATRVIAAAERRMRNRRGPGGAPKV
ncbi:MAG: helix-turn-helix transcriptional regulator [Verrucomicrobia bacterium]|nr:helix-turn-helix transcriptional regulator [Verrucomicrobiota bacterium]